MRLQVLQIICEWAVTHQEFLALDPLCPSRLCSLNRGFPRPAFQESLYIDPSHSGLSLRVVSGSDDFLAHGKNLTDPSISMLKRSCCWKMMTILVRLDVRSCPLCKLLYSQFWSNVVFRRFPLGRWNCWRFFELLHCDEQIQIMNVDSSFLVCLHFHIGGRHRVKFI